MKFIKILLTFIMIFPLIANAENITTSTDDANIDVTVGEVEGASNNNQGVVVSSVEIKWEQMMFTYNVVEDYSWNSSTHKYEKSVSSTYWTNNGNNISIINKSDKKFNITPKYSSKINNIKGSFSSSSFVLDKNATKKISFSLDGVLESTYNNTKIGYITIEIDDV